MTGLVAAVGFLTRIPVPMSMVRGSTGTSGDPDPIAAAVPWFPPVGLLIGAAQGGVYWGAAQLAPPLVAASIATAAGLLVTGAFHHDGLADIADAFGGGWTREQRLDILKDSRLGTYGTAALTMALMVEVAAVGSLSPLAGCTALVAAHGISRAVAVATMLVSKAAPGLAGPAAGTGLGASYVHGLGWAGPVAAIVCSIGAAVVVAPTSGGALLGLGLAVLATVGTVGLARSKIGGLTGDVLGAVQVMSMLAVLVAASAG